MKRVQEAGDERDRVRGLKRIQKGRKNIENTIMQRVKVRETERGHWSVKRCSSNDAFITEQRARGQKAQREM